MKKTLICALTFVTCGLLAADPDPALDAAVAKGAKFLLSKQEADGHWSDAQMPALTALPVWALTGSRADAADAIGKGVKFVLSTQKPDGGFYVPASATTTRPSASRRSSRRSARPPPRC